MKTGHEESGALGWGSRDIEYIYRCSRMQRLSSLTESTAKKKKKKWGKKSEEGWLVHKVGQYKRVEQFSSEEKTKQKKATPWQSSPYKLLFSVVKTQTED